MRRVMLLDWDGPISNSRTWKMPNYVDPVAVKAINDLTAAGVQCVLTSTIRKHYDHEDDAKLELRKCGVEVNWLTHKFTTKILSWRTDPRYVARRHREFEEWYKSADIEAIFGDQIEFIAIDDECYPFDVCEKYRIIEPGTINCNEGMQHSAISEIYRYIESIKADESALEAD